MPIQAQTQLSVLADERVDIWPWSVLSWQAERVRGGDKVELGDEGEWVGSEFQAGDQQVVAVDMQEQGGVKFGGEGEQTALWAVDTKVSPVVAAVNILVQIVQIPPINQRNIKSTTGPSQATHMPMPASASDIQFHSRNKQEEQIDEEQQISVNRD